MTAAMAGTWRMTSGGRLRFELPYPVTRGVQPFQIKDEWYFNMRFAGDFGADGAGEKDGVKFTPLLVAKPRALVTTTS